jgi:hypothetical protein
MTFNLVMNSNNVVAGSNNTRYSYTFLNNNLTILDEAEICVSNITIPYSWFNITTVYANRTFNVIWDIAGTAYTVSFTLQEGFYTINTLNEAFQQLFINQGMYLINQNGNYVYYLTLVYNPSTYGVQLIASVIPSSLPVGWTQPSNFFGYPSVARTPQLSLLSTSNLYQILGFVNNADYPSTSLTVPASFLSTFTPIGSNVNSLIITCNLVNNPCGFPSNILDTMPITSTFASNINYSPYALKWVKISAGTYQKMEIQIVDQNLNAMNILDNNVCISLLMNNKGNPIVETFIPKLLFRD